MVHEWTFSYVKIGMTDFLYWNWKLFRGGKIMGKEKEKKGQKGKSIALVWVFKFTKKGN